MIEEKNNNFLEDIIENQILEHKYPKGILTRFPPEPNGYLHLGHAKSICLNFELAKKYNGKTNLRFDDTNPETEETEYVNSIKEDIKWLGFNWDKELYTSDYFDKLYEFAIILINKNLAYVDDSTADEIAELKGTTTQGGIASIYRSRSVEENLFLFEEMKNGKFKDGEKVLRAKIDLNASNMHLRDPIIYRIKKIKHHRTNEKWCIYPMYDFAHGQSDAIENITHSICTLEFEVHKPLYDWFIHNLNLFNSKQYEFARLNLTYTLMSKRKLLQLVKDKFVDGWDDPRMPTICGLRRRGYTPNAIKQFCNKIGIARRENIIDYNLLEFCVREELNKISKRVMVVLDPIELIIINYEENITEELIAENNPENEDFGNRKLIFSKKLFIERDDFMEDPPKKYFRLSPQTKVRLKNAYIIEYVNCEKDLNGNIIKVYCNYFKNSKSGNDVSGISVKGVIHWVSQLNFENAEIRIYNKLFNTANPAEENKPLSEIINKNSLTILKNAYLEGSLKNADFNDRFQFIRKGYFCLDKNSTNEKKIFNQVVSLKESWVKENK